VIARRSFLLAGSTLLVLAVACKKPQEQQQRCKHCGMRLDPASAWRADLVLADGTTTVPFDTPRCAFTSWRTGKTAASAIRLQEYYERKWRNGEELRFVIGGDVVGPMGPDLVPVDPTRVTKFIQDHAAERSLRLEEVTADVVAKING